MLPPKVASVFPVQTEDLMKKGLRPMAHASLRSGKVQTEDLMKKGLRR
jgi:hypothetical protein